MTRLPLAGHILRVLSWLFRHRVEAGERLAATGMLMSMCVVGRMSNVQPAKSGRVNSWVRSLLIASYPWIWTAWRSPPSSARAAVVGSEAVAPPMASCEDETASSSIVSWDEGVAEMAMACESWDGNRSCSEAAAARVPVTPERILANSSWLMMLTVLSEQSI